MKSPHPISISLAPMEGITTFPMRLWLSLLSRPSAMTTPFHRVTRANAEDGLPADFAPELFELRDVLPYKLTPQFICGDPEPFLRLSDQLNPDLLPVLELNCGCPSPNSMGRLAGSGLLSSPEEFAEVLTRISGSLGPGRFSVKMRLGISDPSEFPDLIAVLRELPLSRLTVHGRTRSDGYRGRANWQRIQEAAKALSFPVHARCV